MRILQFSIAAIVLAGLSAFAKVETLSVTSTAFTNNNMIPQKYTCADQGTNPPLKIAGTPSGTVSMAMIVEDEDGRTRYVIPKKEVVKKTSSRKKTYKTLKAEAPKDSVVYVPGYTQWLIWNVGVTDQIPENFVCDNMGKNSAGEYKYAPLCAQSGTHHYTFTVYALDIKLNISKETGKVGLEKVMKGHILAKGSIKGWVNKTYK